MLWVLWDILLPLLIAFMGGIFVGWLFWRWRRSPVDAATLSTLGGGMVEQKNDSANQPVLKVKTSDRLPTAWRN